MNQIFNFKPHWLTDKLQQLQTILPYLPRTLALIWVAAPRWTLVWALLLIIQGLLPAATISLTRNLVDTLVTALAAEATWQVFLPTCYLVLALALLLLGSEVCRAANNYVSTVQAELITAHISYLVHQQSIAVDMTFYDSADYFDHLHRARHEALHKPLSLLENLGSLVQNSITLVAMLIILLPYGIGLPLVLLVSSLPAFVVAIQHRLRLYQWYLQTTADKRRAWYYDWLLTARETAAEVRVFGLGEHFQSRYQSVQQKLRQEQVRLIWDQSKAELWASGSALLVTSAMLAWMLWRAIQGWLTLGDLVLFYQAFQQGQRLLRSLLQNLSEIYSNSLFLADLFAFLELKPKVTDPPAPVTLPAALPNGGLQQGIRFEQVTFHYPGASRPALADFTLTIPAGQIVAIVGANGAGKSTLLKLLCRLFDPDAGRILLDGVDLRQLSLMALRRQITVLFQEPVHYNGTAIENIVLGDLRREPAIDAVTAAAAAAGADEPIERLPASYDTLLGRWFQGGADLSVGEWQRLALARAYWRQASIIGLDEPTSAMDPWAEHDWLRRFRKLANGRTTLIITHRFTTAMYADIIYVMNNGQVVEMGSHATLVTLNGRYAQSWREQMQMKTAEDNGQPLWRNGKVKI